MIPDIIRMNYQLWVHFDRSLDSMFLFYKYGHFVIIFNSWSLFLSIPMLLVKYLQHSIFAFLGRSIRRYVFGYCLSLSLSLWHLVLLPLYYPYDFLLNRFKIVGEILTNMEIKWKITFPTQH